jgi:hypothetical protein
MSYVLIGLPDGVAKATVQAQDGFSERSFGEQQFLVEQGDHNFRARWLWRYVVSLPVACSVWGFTTLLMLEKSLARKQLAGYLVGFLLVGGLLTFLNLFIYFGFTFWDNVKV